MADTRQEFELALGTGKALGDLSPECIRMIRNAVPFANTGRDEYLQATWDADPLPRDMFAWPEAQPDIPQSVRDVVTGPIVPCDVCEMGNHRSWQSRQHRPVQVLCNACLDNEVRLDPRGVRASRPEAYPAQAAPKYCKTCQGRRWVMRGEHKDLGHGMGSGGSWNAPCPDCVVPAAETPKEALVAARTPEHVRGCPCIDCQRWDREHPASPAPQAPSGWQPFLAKATDDGLFRVRIEHADVPQDSLHIDPRPRLAKLLTEAADAILLGLPAAPSRPSGEQK